MKKHILVLSLLALGLSSCATQPSTTKQPTPKTYQAPTAKKQPLFQKAMISVAKSTLNDPNYHKMALNTPEKKAWFRTLMYRLWDRQITRQEFIEQGLEKYPSKRYEFKFVANGFQMFS